MIGTTLNQRFRLDKELGQGGMGTVYLAADTILNRDVAVKVLKDLRGEELERQVLLEAQITARLQHDHIVRLYDIGKSEGLLFLVMEVVDGRSFHYRWSKLSLAERLRVVAEVAKALDYAHRQGVIHRDIKPGNVLMTSSDHAKLSDFGLSVLVDDVKESRTVRGTPLYMSPEQASGKKLDHRTDLYALGVILYECATGNPPFLGAAMAVMTQHVNAQPEPPRAKVPHLPTALERLILDLLAKKPEARPSRGAEIAEALRDLADMLRAGPGGPAVTTETPSRPHPNTAPTAVTPGKAGQGDIPTLQATGKTGMPAARPSDADDRTRAVPESSVRTERQTASASAVEPRRRARILLDALEETPLVLMPEQRYLGGHYLAYLLGGSRRRGLLGRRPLDALNADRARLLLAMTALMVRGGTQEAVEDSARLIEEHFDVRPMLSPLVVAKYLASRETGSRRKAFRQGRQMLLEASPYAQANLVDSQGLLNPGLMPQTYDDLWKVSPPMTEVDDQLVRRWNRLTEVWREDAAFRLAVLRYATSSAWRDPESPAMWPEVVYPLIERARWQRQLRSRAEAFWNLVGGKILHLPDAGVRLDDAMKAKVPEAVAVALDVSLEAFEEDPVLEVDAESPRSAEERIVDSLDDPPATFHELVTDKPGAKASVRLSPPDPLRVTMGELRDLWQEALTTMQANPNKTSKHRNIGLGSYRLSVVPTIRGKGAGEVILQGHQTKSVGLLVPSIRLSSNSSSRPVIALWTYEDQSVAVTHIDHRNIQKYVCLHGPTGVQQVFEDAGEFNHVLFQYGLESPDQLTRVLTKAYRPSGPAVKN